MKHAASTLFLASALVAQQAAATYSWGSAKTFNTPQNCDNQCSSDQSGGYSWGGLTDGDFGSFDGFDFSGFIMQNSFKGKRDLTARSSDKCIVGSATKGSNTGSKSPSFSCSDRAFSIDTIDISVEYDTDLEFLHTMSDGSTCKHVTSCSGRSTVKNSQCGGSQSVTVQVPSYGNDKPCSIGIHTIGFDCNGGGKSSTSKTKTQTKTSETQTKTSEIKTTQTKTSETKTSEVPTKSTEVPPPETTSTTVVSPAPSGNLSISLTSPTTPPPQSTSTDVETSVVTITSCGPEVPDCPAGSTTVVTPPAVTTPPPAVTTVITVVTTSVCPVTSTIVSGSSTIVHTTSTISTVTLTTTSTVCNKCTEAPSTTFSIVTSPAATTSKAPSSTGTPDTGCPEIVPSCLNTWLSYLPECKDNSDVSCFCPSSEFTDLLYSCLQAYGADDDEVQAAASYFAGICAAYVPQNPGIITACPSTITLTATPAATVTVTGAAPPPVTTISISVVISSSTVTSAVTVPQVAFTTATPYNTGVGPSAVQSTSTIGLVPGTAAPPTSNPAATVTATTGGSRNTTVASSTATTSFTPFEGAAVKVDSRFGVWVAVAAAGLAVLA